MGVPYGLRARQGAFLFCPEKAVIQRATWKVLSQGQKISLKAKVLKLPPASHGRRQRSEERERIRVSESGSPRIARGCNAKTSAY